MWSSIGYTAFNMLIFVPFKLILDSQLNFKTVMDPAKTPSLWQFLPQYLIMLFFEDLTFFVGHWMMHHPKLYRFHKVHHEYTTTVSLAGLHIQFFDLLLSQSLSSFIVMKMGAMYAPLHADLQIDHARCKKS